MKGHIREIASAADPASRTYRVKATLLEDAGSRAIGHDGDGLGSLRTRPLK